MTRFANMTEDSRNGWVAWCNHHDWSEEYPVYFDGDTLCTGGWEHDGEGWRVCEARHDCPRDLKAWAGY